jgi:hypothetical protein
MSRLTSKIVVALVLAFTAVSVAGCIPAHPVTGGQYI